MNITVKLRTDATGRDVFLADASGLPPKTSFTVFLLEVPGAPFGGRRTVSEIGHRRTPGRAHVANWSIATPALAASVEVDTVSRRPD